MTRNDLPLDSTILSYILKGKGRPKESPGPGSRSRDHDATLHDKALIKSATKSHETFLHAVIISAFGPELKATSSSTGLCCSRGANMPSTTTNSLATGKALKWLQDLGYTYKAGAEMRCKSHRTAPLLRV
ncbi:hypothetical protein E4U59_005345 [Claviceps monticola]|nr:hypothetical protein E4U59_005345 [Claviceps monticola]